MDSILFATILEYKVESNGKFQKLIKHRTKCILPDENGCKRYVHVTHDVIGPHFGE